MAACGGANSSSEIPDDGISVRPLKVRPGSGERMTVRGETGAIDRQKAQATFADAMPEINRCVEDGRKRLPYLGGDIDIFVEIDGFGRASGVQLTSSLGDHLVESCIHGAISSRQWPRPIGGDRGEARQQISFKPPGHLDAPLLWSAATLSEKMAADNDGDQSAYRDLISKLDSCRSEAKAERLTVTLYLDEDGMAQGVGLSAVPDHGREAIDCVKMIVTTTSFPSQNSRIKATVTVP